MKGGRRPRCVTQRSGGGSAVCPSHGQGRPPGPALPCCLLSLSLSLSSTLLALPYYPPLSSVPLIIIELSNFRSNFHNPYGFSSSIPCELTSFAVQPCTKSIHSLPVPRRRSSLIFIFSSTDDLTVLLIISFVFFLPHFCSVSVSSRFRLNFSFPFSSPRDFNRRPSLRYLRLKYPPQKGKKRRSCCVTLPNWLIIHPSSHRLFRNFFIIFLSNYHFRNVFFASWLLFFYQLCLSSTFHCSNL